MVGVELRTNTMGSKADTLLRDNKPRSTSENSHAESDYGR